jgi:hypothetical protein
MNLALVVALACGVAACSSGSSSDCSGVAEEIRQAAIKRGYDGDGDGQPDAKGVCGSTNPTIQKDFANACARLKACQDN